MKKKGVSIFFHAFLSGISLVGIAAGIVLYKLYAPALKLNNSVAYIYIDDKKDYANVLSQLESTAHIKDIHLFERLASAMKYPGNIKSGKYKVDSKISYLELVRKLRSGNQTPVKLTFNNMRLKTDFARRIGEQLMLDSDALLRRLNNPEVAEGFGFDTTTFITMFIPDTYEIYWNTSADAFIDRMKKEYDHFWNESRREKARTLALSPVEISVLASIVEEETAKKEEYPIVAGLYINRLYKGMFLQADPTVKFAVGDVTLRRILFAHLAVESPYNTYRNPGLPPGPIRIPSIAGIDGVLNYSHHNYLYMAAKEDFSGKHNFAVTLAEHNRNAQKYQAALNRNHIY